MNVRTYKREERSREAPRQCAPKNPCDEIKSVKTELRLKYISNRYYRNKSATIRDEMDFKSDGAMKAAVAQELELLCEALELE